MAATTTLISSGSTTIGAGVSLSVAGGNAAYAYSSYTPTLTNYGTLIGGGLSRYGVRFAGTGTVINTGSIGGGGGVRIDAAGASVSNGGTIGGTLGMGIRLLHGGAVDNSVGGQIGGIYASGALTLDNAGTIAGSYTAVTVASTALVTNSGTILAPKRGVQTEGGSLVNAGTIVGTVTYGVQFGGGGLSNLAGAVIASNSVALGVFGAGNSILNAGTIGGASGTARIGVYMRYGGVLTNTATGTISGVAAVVSRGAAGTVTNAGLITGGVGVRLHAGYANVLNLATGGTIVGTIDGGNALGSTAVSTIQLYGTGALSGIGTVGDIGAHVVNFGSVVFRSGAAWSIAGYTDALGSAAITGFAPGDRIDVRLAGVAQSVAVSGSSVSLFTSADRSGAPFFTFTNLTGLGGTALDPALIVASPDPLAGTFLTIACFAAGTRIATQAGPVAVEDLRQGDRVVSAFGGMAPVRWVGHRRIDCRRHPRPGDVWPVRVMAGAFGDGMPARDLFLSPDHAVFADGHLIPIRYLVNGATVAQVPRESVTYFHVELPAHDVVLAEGLAAETYLDTGNRGAFANGGGATMLHADFALRVWESEACAPLAVGGDVVTGVQRRLLDRAAGLGFARTGDAALRVLVDGREVALRDGCVDLPAGAGEARLVSRSFVPAEMFPGNPDCRRLGVAVADLSGAQRTSGWHAGEDGRAWTDGDGRLALTGARLLRLRMVDCGARFWVESEAAMAGVSAIRRSPGSIVW